MSPKASNEEVDPLDELELEEENVNSEEDV